MQGWGCAYRSLQTIFSWFLHAGLYEGNSLTAVPTIRDIQEALVTMGDKQPRFLGSREWIGATEVGMVLSHLLPQVERKIIPLPSGSKLGDMDICRLLAAHFDSSGAPVMIGTSVCLLAPHMKRTIGVCM